MKRHRRPLNRSITIGCIIFLLLLSVLLSVANLTLHRNFVYQDYQVYIQDIINYTMIGIDGDDLKTCIETKTETEKYKETLLFMDKIIDNYHDIHYLYVITPLNTNETGNIMSVLSAERYEDRYVNTEGNLYLGWISEDEYDSASAKRFFDVMNGNETVFFEEHTGWGTDYTGAVAIKDSAGTGIAVLCVDIDISFINQSIINYALVNITVITVLGVIFIVLFLLWSRSNITLPIKMLEEGAVSFVNKSSGQRDINKLEFTPPEIKQDNEIKALSDAVVKMTEDMREYVADIINAEEKAMNMQILANRDALTGIRNKMAYENEISSIDDIKVGLAVIDLNNLKTVNDEYGHEKGDISIKKLASIICEVFSHSPVFRIGGDEFVIVLRKYDYDHYNELQDRFISIILDMSKDESLSPWERVSAAIGAAFFKEGDDMNSLFERADHEMYACKKKMKEELAKK